MSLEATTVKNCNMLFKILQIRLIPKRSRYKMYRHVFSSNGSAVSPLSAAVFAHQATIYLNSFN
jgi:hypothetical protein